MSKTHKIHAFTLSEIMVVLILTTIVVGIAFSVLRLVQKQMLAIQNNYNTTLQLNLLETSLWLDFNRYPKAYYNDLDDVLVFKSPLDSVKYQFTEQHIIKDKDTFSMQLSSKTAFNKGDITLNGNIDALKLETSKMYLKQRLFIFKSNTALDYMTKWDLK